jgi:hypothetical protein
MAIRHTSVRDYISYSYDHRKGVYTINDWSATFHERQNKEDTYIIIFGPNVDSLITAFEELCAKSGIKILFKSQKAYNYNYDYPDPRNTLIIFEFE